MLINKTDLVCFMKANNNSIQNSIFKDASELEKMYVLPTHKGHGIGKKAFKKVVETSKERGKKILFLDVLDTN